MTPSLCLGLGRTGPDRLPARPPSPHPPARGTKRSAARAEPRKRNKQGSEGTAVGRRGPAPLRRRLRRREPSRTTAVLAARQTHQKARLSN